MKNLENKSLNELEVIKLQDEIKLLNKPFYKRAEFLSIIVSALVASLTIYFTILKAESDALEKVKLENIKTATLLNDLESKDLFIQKNELIQSIEELKKKEKSYKDSLDIFYYRGLQEIKQKLRYIEGFNHGYSKSYPPSFVSSEGVQNRLKKYIDNETKRKECSEWLILSIRRAMQRSNSNAIQEFEKELKVREFELINN